MTLNGRALLSDEKGTLPDLSPEAVLAGKVTIAPGGCSFFVL